MTENDVSVLLQLPPEKLDKLWDYADDHGGVAEGHAQGNINRALGVLRGTLRGTVIDPVEVAAKDFEPSVPVKHISDFINSDPKFRRRGY